MSMILFACVAAGAAAVGWASGRKARERHDQTQAAQTAMNHPPPNPFVAFPCGLKDVLGRTKDDEALLTGGLRLSEGGAPLAAIFFAIGAPGVARIVAAFPSPKTDVLWLTTDTSTTLGAEPPSTLLVGDATLERTRRIPVLVERFGTDIPEVDREATLAEYRGGAGQAALLLKGAKHGLLAVGDVVSFSSLERYPGS